MSYQSKLIVCVLFFAANISSAITIGRNGGGLPEMEIVSLLSGINQYLEICVRLESKCNLKPLYFEAAKSAANRTRETKVNVAYTFSMNAPFKWSEDGTLVTINQSALYHVDQSGKNTNELLKLAFAATLFFEFKQDSKKIPELLDFFESWNCPFLSEKRTLMINEFQSFVHIISLKNTNISDTVLLEGPSQTTEIHDLIRDKLDSSIWKITNSSWDGTYLIFSVEFIRNNRKITGDLVASLRLNENRSALQIQQLNLVNLNF